MVPPSWLAIVVNGQWINNLWYVEDNWKDRHIYVNSQHALEREGTFFLYKWEHGNIGSMDYYDRHIHR
jgi:hypothetical protein